VRYVKEHPVATIALVGVTLYVCGALAELAVSIPQFFMWLGGALFFGAFIIGVSEKN
jgi:hypothetical protein